MFCCLEINVLRIGVICLRFVFGEKHVFPYKKNCTWWLRPWPLSHSILPFTGLSWSSGQMLFASITKPNQLLVVCAWNTLPRACAHRIPRILFGTTSFRRCFKNGTSGIDLRYAERNSMEYMASIPTHYETCHPKSPITLLVLPRSTPGGFRLCRLIITWKPIPNCAFSGFACMQIDLQSESRPSKPVSAPKASRTKKHWCHCLWPWAPVIVFNRLITSRQSASKDEPFSGISWNFQIFHILSMSLQL